MQILVDDRCIVHEDINKRGHWSDVDLMEGKDQSSKIIIQNSY